MTSEAELRPAELTDHTELLARLDAQAAECERWDQPDRAGLHREAGAAIRTLLGEREWRPIESAPKDGTRILIWLEPTKIAMPFQWAYERWMGDDLPLNMAEPTHWLPLPKGPTP